MWDNFFLRCTPGATADLNVLKVPHEGHAAGLHRAETCRTRHFQVNLPGLAGPSDSVAEKAAKPLLARLKRQHFLQILRSFMHPWENFQQLFGQSVATMLQAKAPGDPRSSCHKKTYCRKGSKPQASNAFLAMRKTHLQEPLSYAFDYPYRGLRSSPPGLLRKPLRAALITLGLSVHTQAIISTPKLLARPATSFARVAASCTFHEKSFVRKWCLPPAFTAQKLVML